MAKVLGVGGVFFKSPDPARLRKWYAQWLGVPAEEYGAMFSPETMPSGGMTIWNPFAATTDYFAPSPAPFMINLVVDDMDGALAQVREGGATVVRSEDSDFGRFGWFIDPDGNKVELWQPPVPDQG
jgi:predicted enzyme related to lactoylglutathione lyase